MIRFGAIVSVVAVAMGLLVAGAVAGDLTLVYVSITLAALALVMLIAGVVMWRDEIFGPAGADGTSAGRKAGAISAGALKVGAVPDRVSMAARFAEAGPGPNGPGPRPLEPGPRAAEGDRPDRFAPREPTPSPSGRPVGGRDRAASSSSSGRGAPAHSSNRSGNRAGAPADTRVAPMSRPQQPPDAARLTPAAGSAAAAGPGVVPAAGPGAVPAASSPSQPARARGAGAPAPGSTAPGSTAPGAAAPGSTSSGSTSSGSTAPDAPMRRDSARPSDSMGAAPRTGASARGDAARPTGRPESAGLPGPEREPAVRSSPFFTPASPVPRDQDKPADRDSLKASLAPPGVTAPSREPVSLTPAPSAETAAKDVVPPAAATAASPSASQAKPAGPATAGLPAPAPTEPSPAPTALAPAAAGPAPTAAAQRPTADLGAGNQDGPASASKPAAVSPASGAASASVDANVSVVPGIARYHTADCILIRFLSADDLEIMTQQAAEESGCVPCRACRPGKAGADG